MPESSETSTLPLRKFRVRDLAYIAGLLDGEGTITAFMDKRGCIGTSVLIANSYLPVLEWVQSILGGRIVERGGKNYPAHWRPVWKWCCPAVDQTALLKMLVPYLQIKQQNAYQLMALIACRKNGVSRDKLRNMVDRLKALNHPKEDTVQSPGAISGQ